MPGNGITRRRTKIVATLGPATDDREVLRAVIEAGADVLRISFSHGNADDHARRAQAVREVSAGLGREVAILGDLQGPKIRVGHFDGGKVELARGDEFILDGGEPHIVGDRRRVGVSYAGLTRDVAPGDVLLLDDGLISMRVRSVEGARVICEVENGGVLRDRKGINLRGGGLSISGVTPQDIEEIPLAAELGLDFLAVSFARNADDIRRVRAMLRQAGSTAAVVAKIERIEAVENLESICDTADAILVARGDLGVEIGDSALPGIQKRIIKTAIEYNVSVVTATQMMQSMVENPIPTRAEVLDVANAVIDGTDAVMLSAETAVGKHPARVIEAAHRVCLGAERHQEQFEDINELNVRFQRIDQAVAMAATYLSTKVSVQAIVSFTESGSTAQWLSRVQSPVPIFALSPGAGSRRKMAMLRNVYPVCHEGKWQSMEELVSEGLKLLWRKGEIVAGDRVILTMGERMGNQGGTNTMRLIRLGADGLPEVQTELDLH